MKANKKALALVLCALMLVAASVFGTLAYLVDTDNKVTNTFTVGNVEITLDEAKVDVNGVVEKDADGNAVPRVTENSYKLMPGHKYTKDPIVHVAEGSENCYVFVRITNAIAGIEADDNTIADQMAKNGWVAVGVEGVTGVYYYGTDSSATAVAANANLPVFEEFTIDGAEDAETLKDYTGTTIVVKAYAIQADGLAANDVAAIWAALKSEKSDA